MDAKSKTCSKCGEEKLLEKFPTVNVKGKEYKRKQCRDCYLLSKSKDTEKYLKRKQQIEELHLLQKDGKRRCLHCNKIKVLNDFPNDYSNEVYYNKKSYCKQCFMDKWARPYRRTDRAKKLKSIADKKSYAKHRKKRNATYLKGYHDNPERKIKHNLRVSLGNFIRKHKSEKKCSAIKLVGCDIECLKKHLENQFQPGMSWDNWSRTGWHIDHIIPLNLFDVSDTNHQKKCFNYRNLRPLWAKENISKQDTLDMDLIKSYGIEDLLPEGVDK